MHFRCSNSSPCKKPAVQSKCSHHGKAIFADFSLWLRISCVLKRKLILRYIFFFFVLPAETACYIGSFPAVFSKKGL